MKTLLERSLERKLVAALKSRGHLCLKQAETGINGVPDRLCLFEGGRAVFVELKRPFETPRLNQLRMLRRLAGLGFEAVVIDSPAELTAFLERHDCA